MAKTNPKTKSFTNHTPNGVLLKFTNGNKISTVWGVGTYADNQYKYSLMPQLSNFPAEREKQLEQWLKKRTELLPEGSNTAEVMPFCSKKLYKQLEVMFPDQENGGVFTYLSMEDWLKMVNFLNTNL